MHTWEGCWRHSHKAEHSGFVGASKNDVRGTEVTFLIDGPDRDKNHETKEVR